MMPANHINDESGTIRVQYLVVTDGSLIGLTFYPLSKRESLPGNGNLANYPRLMKSWLLEENL